jgi:diacylglycerol kinase family enzyme
MRILLVYNPNAGDGVDASLRDLVDFIHAAGHDVRCRSSKDPLVTSALAEPADLVAVAGGDGTIIKVARHLRGRKTAIAPLPMGTANNISTALGLMASSLEEQILGWTAGQLVRIDLGVARSPRGARSFLESVGAGLLSGVMSELEHHDATAGATTAESRLASALAHFRRAAERSPAIDVRAQLDGDDVSGRYVLLEAMNIGWAGPNLNLAVDADAGDGELDLVLVREADRGVLIECLSAHGDGALCPHPLPTRRGRHLRIEAGRFDLHVDDELWRAQGPSEAEACAIDVTLRDKVSFLVSAVEDGARRRRGAPLSRREIRQSLRRNRRSEATPLPWGWPAGRPARSRR